VAELEDFLFGGSSAAPRREGRAAYGSFGAGSDDDELDIADLIRQAGAIPCAGHLECRDCVGDGGNGEPLLFVEDRRGAEPPPGLGLPRQTRAQRRAAALAAAGGGVVSEDGDEQREGALGAAARGGGGGSSDEAGGDSDATAGSDDSDSEPPRRAALRGPDAAASGSDDGEGDAGAAGPGPGSARPRVPVWADPSDREVRVDISARARLRKLRADKGQGEVSGTAYEAALRRQHAALHGGAGWAALPSERRRRRQQERERGRGRGGGAGESGASDEGEDAEDGAAERLLRGAGGLLAGRAAAA
ncbi:hypothetical protein MNEG_16388, partial [Monoraphidium neglectum]